MSLPNFLIAASKYSKTIRPSSTFRRTFFQVKQQTNGASPYLHITQNPCPRPNQQKLNIRSFQMVVLPFRFSDLTIFASIPCTSFCSYQPSYTVITEPFGCQSNRYRYAPLHHVDLSNCSWRHFKTSGFSFCWWRY